MFTCYAPGSVLISCVIAFKIQGWNFHHYLYEYNTNVFNMYVFNTNAFYTLTCKLD